MKTLPADFVKCGFHYRLITRQGDVAVYQKFLDRSQHQEHFEVFRVQRHNGRVIDGRTIPPAEFMPASESWGQLGWSFIELGKAMSKSNSLCARPSETARLTIAKPPRIDSVAVRG